MRNLENLIRLFATPCCKNFSLSMSWPSGVMQVISGTWVGFFLTTAEVRKSITALRIAQHLISRSCYKKSLLHETQAQTCKSHIGGETSHLHELTVLYLVLDEPSGDFPWRTQWCFKHFYWTRKHKSIDFVKNPCCCCTSANSAFLKVKFTDNEIAITLISYQNRAVEAITCAMSYLCW